jgi:hypothetical protein
MHRMKLPRTVAVWLVLSLQTVAVPAFGSVLCIADDGHMAIEADHGAARCEAEYVRHHPDDSPRALDADAHGCRDIPIVQVPVRKALANWGAAAGRPAGVSTPALPPLHLTRVQVFERASTVGFVATVVPLLRTIVLLV